MIFLCLLLVVGFIILLGFVIFVGLWGWYVGGVEYGCLCEVDGDWDIGEGMVDCCVMGDGNEGRVCDGELLICWWNDVVFVFEEWGFGRSWGVFFGVVVVNVCWRCCCGWGGGCGGFDDIFGVWLYVIGVGDGVGINGCGFGNVDIEGKGEDWGVGIEG